MLILTDEQLDWIAERIPDAPVSPKSRRPVADKRRTLRGIFWMLDNDAKWKDLPVEFGSKSTVHRWFAKWVADGVFERLLQSAGRLVETRGGYRLYECFIDATFSKAKGGGDGVGVTRVGKGVKIMVLVDARGLPVAVDTAAAGPHESKLVQRLFDFMLTEQTPPRVIGDKAYDSDELDEQLAERGIAMIAPHRGNRKPENVTQDRRPLDGGAQHRVDPELPPSVYSLGEVDQVVSGLLASRMHTLVAQTGFGIASSESPLSLVGAANAAIA